MNEAVNSNLLSNGFSNKNSFEFERSPRPEVKRARGPVRTTHAERFPQVDWRPYQMLIGVGFGGEGMISARGVPFRLQHLQLLLNRKREKLAGAFEDLLAGLGLDAMTGDHKKTDILASAIDSGSNPALGRRVSIYERSDVDDWDGLQIHGEAL